MVNIKNVIIDVDVIIEKWNKKNPDSKNPMSRKRLAKLIGKTEQTLSLWKVGTTPKLIYTLYQLMEIGECKLNDFIKPEK